MVDSDYGQLAQGASDGSVTFQRHNATTGRIYATDANIRDAASALGAMYYVLDQSMKDPNRDGLQDLSQFGGLPSGEHLIQQYQLAANHCMTALGAHKGIVANLLDTFISAARTYREAEGDSSSLWGHNLSDGTKPDFDSLTTAPSFYQDPRAAGSTYNDPAKIVAQLTQSDVSATSAKPDSWTVSVPFVPVGLFGLATHQEQDPTKAIPSLGDVAGQNQGFKDAADTQPPNFDVGGNHENPWYYGDYPWRFWWVERKNASYRGDYFAQRAADLWAALYQNIKQSSDDIEQKLHNFTLPDYWDGAGRDAAYKAVSNYVQSLDPFLKSMHATQMSLEYTSEWLGRFWSYMPASQDVASGSFQTPIPDELKASNGVGHQDPDVQGTFAPTFDSVYNQGYKGSLASIPVFTPPGGVAPGKPDDTYTTNNGPVTNSPGSPGGSVPSAGVPNVPAGPSVPTGPSPTQPQQTDPLSQGLQALQQALQSGQQGLQSMAQQGSQAAQAAEQGAQQAAGQGVQAAEQAAQQLAQAIHGGPQSAQQALKDAEKAAGLSKAEKDALKNSGGGGALGGGGIGGAGALAEDAALAEESGAAKLFPRAALTEGEEAAEAVQSAEAEEAAAGRAGMAPMAGMPGGAGAAGAAGQQKERKRADYLDSARHLEEAFDEPLAVKAVVEPEE